MKNAKTVIVDRDRESYELSGSYLKTSRSRPNAVEPRTKKNNAESRRMTLFIHPVS